MRRLIGFIIVVIVVLLCVGAYLYFKKNEVKDHLTLYGNVDVRQVDLGFRVLGRVDIMPFQEGDTVKPGTLMGSLDKQPFLDEVLQAKANALAIKASLKNQIAHCKQAKRDCQPRRCCP